MTEALTQNVCLYLDKGRVFRWHVWLAEALISNPDYVLSINFAPDSRPLPRDCFVLFGLERFVHRIKGSTAIDSATLRPTTDQRLFDTIIDFSLSDHSLLDSNRVLTPHFNGMPGEIGAITALLRDEPLMIGVADSRSGRSLTGSPAITDRGILVKALDNLLSCTVGLILKTLRDRSIANHLLGLFVFAPTPPPWTLIKRATTTVVQKVVRQIDKLVSGDTQWAVAWRIGSRSLLDMQKAEFAVIADDGDHYYADPFPVRRDGDFIFMERFSYASGRGSIVVVRIDCDNRLGEVVPVLSENHHLSYPFLFEGAGELWMIPEAGASQGVDLYRAEKFPYQWRREGRLLHGVNGYDATILRYGKRLWMFVCEKIWNSSSWDELSLFSTESLTGPWLPHAENPVLIDAALSRSGGAVFAHNGRLLRPVQDCSQLYGGGLSLCSIDAIDDSDFSQTVRGRIYTDGTSGCHTFNNHRGLEVVDIFARRLSSVTVHFRED
jgi:hypothetical protein